MPMGEPAHPIPPVTTHERVVIGVDFSEASIAAIHWVRRALAPDAELVLVHAIEVPEPPPFLRGLHAPREDVVSTARRGAEVRFRELRASVAPGRVWTEIRVARASECLATVASEYGASLVVIGTHRERPGVWNRLGTTAERVLSISPVPVVLTTGELRDAPQHLLVPVDDAESFTRLLGWLQALMRVHGSRVTTLHVVPSSTLGYLLTGVGVGVGSVAPVVTAPDDLLALEAEQWKQRLLAAGLDADRVSCEVIFGEPGRAIVEATTRLSADMIVMGRSGAGKIRRALMGSVTREVLRGATCPVLVIVEGGGE